jgi:hypothetical protein
MRISCGMLDRKVFFSEEKKQKTFIFWYPYPVQLRQQTKVFWFFFSKKNCFL